MKMSHCISAVCTVLLAIPLTCGLGGCAGYKLGSMLPHDVKSVNVPTFINKTKEPQIEVETTRATIEEIQKDGSLHVANEAEADSILEVTLVNYTITPVAYQKDKPTATRQYRLTLTASILLKRRSDDSVLVENPRVKGEKVFDVVGDLTSSKSTGLPDAAADLAHNIVERLVEVW